MALFRFTEAMLQGRAIDLYNQGEMARDFTYIDDIVEGILRLLDKPPALSAERGTNRLFNIGRGSPVALLIFVECLEQALGMKVEDEFVIYERLQKESLDSLRI